IGKSVDRMTREEKITVLSRLDGQGVLQMRKGVENVAARLGISRVTAYSYLDEARTKAEAAKKPAQTAYPRQEALPRHRVPPPSPDLYLGNPPLSPLRIPASSTVTGLRSPSRHRELTQVHLPGPRGDFGWLRGNSRRGRRARRAQRNSGRSREATAEM